MKYDIPLLLAFVAIGLIFKKMTWRGWFGVALLIALWMTLNLIKTGAG